MGLGQIIRDKRESLELTQDQLAAQAGISKPYLSNIETGRGKNPPTDRVLRALEAALGFVSGQLTRLGHLARTPVDVRSEHDLLEAEVKQLRSILRGVAAGAPQKDFGGIDLDALLRRADSRGNIRTIAAGPAVPIINKVAAGYPSDFTDLDYPTRIADEYVRCPDLYDAQAFAARVVGDSMEPDYVEGDIVVFSHNTPAHNGDDCFVRFDSDGGSTFKRYYQDDEHTIRLQPLNSTYPAETYPRQRITGLYPAVFRIQQIRKA